MENVGAACDPMGPRARLHHRRALGGRRRRSGVLSDDAHAPPAPHARSMTANSMVTERVPETLRSRLVTLRRELHRQPELAFNEVHTSRTLEAALRDLGIDDI